MLSIRDSGKIQNENASILQLAQQCGLHKPFSLKEFVERECIIDVLHFRICVVIFAWLPNDTAKVRISHDPAWYGNYFLNWHNPLGVGQFWYKESFGKLRFEGDVTSALTLNIEPEKILVLNNDNTPSKIVDRNKAADLCRQIAGEQFPGRTYDAFITVVGVPSDYDVNGGTTGNCSVFKADAGTFDFYAHEVGHLIGGKLGYDHSFGRETPDCATKYSNSEYGDPYCVMSAMTYGDYPGGVTFDPGKAPPLAREETGRPPGLNGATRLLLGWAKGIEFDLAENREAEFELQSLGSNRPGLQIVRVRQGESTFCAEYRSGVDPNDRGIKKDVVALSALESGIARRHDADPGGLGHPGKSTTYLDEVLYAPSGSSGSNKVANFNPFWGVKVMEWNPAKHTVRIKIVRNFALSVRTYFRTHDVGTRCLDGLRSWRINGRPLTSFRADLLS
jgi:hypothetical protein